MAVKKLISLFAGPAVEKIIRHIPARHGLAPPVGKITSHVLARRPDWIQALARSDLLYVQSGAAGSKDTSQIFVQFKNSLQKNFHVIKDSQLVKNSLRKFSCY